MSVFRRTPLCVLLVSILLAACPPPPTERVEGPDCPEVPYTATGSVVTTTVDCPPESCPFVCGSSGTCWNRDDDVHCEDCRALVDYLAADCPGCFLYLLDDSIERYEGAFSMECWGEQK